MYKLECDTLKKVVLGCAEIDKSVVEDLAKNKNLDTYVVFDDSKKIDYLNLDGDVIGLDTKTIRKTMKSSKNSKLRTKTLKVKKYF